MFRERTGPEFEQWIPSPIVRTAALAGVVFLLDWIAPLGIAMGVAYMAIVLSAVPIRHPRAVYITAGCCTLLVVLGWTVSPSRGETEPWKVILNECLALSAIWLSAAIADAWTRLQDRRIKDLQEIRLLQQAAALSIATHSLDDALQSCLEIICDITGWPVGLVYRPDPAHQRLVPSPIWHIEDDESLAPIRKLLETTTLARGEGLVGRIWERNEAVWVANIRSNPALLGKRSELDLPIVGAFGFPVTADGEIQAVLEFLSPDEVAPDPQLLTLATRIGDELGRIIERRRWEDERARLAAVVDSSYDAIIGISLDGLITSWNRGAEGVYGYTADEAIGQPIRILAPEGRPDIVPTPNWLPSQGRELKQFESVRRHKEGRLIDVSMTISPLRDSEGQVIGTSSIERDITILKRREAELLRAKDQAEAASRTKSEFVANISHELRTPMNAILGMLDLSQRQPGISPQVHDYLETARDSADLLLSLVNDLLDFSRMETGHFELDDEPFHLRETLGEAMRILALRAHEQGLDLILKVADDVPDNLVGDERRLRQVVMNLVGNAIKFTPEGQISVEVRLEPGFTPPEIEDDEETRQPVQLHLRVKDTGIGIARKDQDRIFRPFTQVDSSSTRRYPGTGLGLTICKELIEKMGGRIWLESEPDVGTIFHCTPVLQIQDAGDKVTDSVTFDPPHESSAPVGSDSVTIRPSETGTPAAVPIALNLLVVEDTLANQKVIRALLEDRGHTVTLTANGREAITLAGSRRFDAILMDVQMPVMNGLEATRAIRAFNDPYLAEVPIIALTAHAMRADREECRQAGMNGYIAKPINSQELFLIVERLAREPCSTLLTPSNHNMAALTEASAPHGYRADEINLPNALERMGGNFRLLKDTVQFFIEDAPGLLKEVEEGLAIRDRERVTRAAHSLKGLAATFDAHAASAAAGTIEQAARSGDLPAARKRYPELEGSLRSVVDRLYREVLHEEAPAGQNAG